jgi:hypothetical protein
MGWQERKREIDEALSILKKEQGRIGEKRRRTHDETMEYRAAKIIVLERGVCKECQGLVIRIARVERRKRGVALKCKFGGEPVGLYRENLYQPELTLTCPSHKPLEREEEDLTI